MRFHLFEISKTQSCCPVDMRVKETGNLERSEQELVIRSFKLLTPLWLEVMWQEKPWCLTISGLLFLRSDRRFEFCLKSFTHAEKYWKNNIATVGLPETLSTNVQLSTLFITHNNLKRMWFLSCLGGLCLTTFLRCWKLDWNIFV